MTLQIGAIIKERYRILQLIASGGMGLVYRAKDESLGVDVAIKMAIPGKISAAHMQKNAALLAGLHHPGIPRVTDTFELDDGTQILVMDFVPGEDLKNRVDTQGPFKVGDAINVITAIGSALKYMHKQNPPVIHQDVKPGNIRITPDGNAMLIDFDLAASLQDNQTQPTTQEQGLTPGFAAPEQYNRMADARSDQYALAATLFFILTGAMLPDGISRASGNDQLPAASSSRIPLDILTCLEKALNINPADRYVEIQAFLDALASILKTQPKLVTKAARNQQYNRQKPKNKFLIPILLSLSVLIVTGGVLYFYLDREEPGKPSTPVPVIPSVPVVASVPSTIPSVDVKPTGIKEPTNSPVPLPSVQNTVVNNVLPTPLGGGTGNYAYVSEKTGIPQVFLSSISSDRQEQMTNVPEGACQPAWSPDGTQIIFISPCPLKSQLTGRNEPYSGAGLFIMSLENKQILPIPSKPGGDFDPTWSPDGKQIAFASLRTQISQIFVYDLTTDSIQQLTNTNFPNRQPAWSPDGKMLAFSSSRTGTQQIWLMAADGSGQKAFSRQNNGAAFTADWTPDGKNLIFSLTNSQQLARKPVDAAVTDVIVLNPRLSYAYNPDVSPDGQWILFDSNTEGNFQVYRISIKGSGVEPISPSSEISYQPVWRP